MLLRKFEQEDQDGLIDLLNLAYNGWHSIEYFRWKHRKNPHGNSLIWIAEEDNKIVGCYVANPVKLRIGKASVLGAQSVDAAVDPKYRGLGLFKKLARRTLDEANRKGIVATYAFPSYIAYKGQIRIGYQYVFVLPKIFKLLDPSRLLAKYGLASKNLQKIAKHFLSFRRKTSREEPIVDEFKIGQIKVFEKQFEDFWKTFCEKNNYIMIERDREYLNWRYFGNPDKEYVVYVCKQGKKILGYLVLSIERNDPSIGNIVDILTLPNMPEVATCLILRCLNHFEKERLDLARCWMFKHNLYYPILKNQGFSEYLELMRRLVFRSKYVEKLILYVNSSAKLSDTLNAGISNSRDDLKWFITQGDSDWV